jgi:AraC-like DNA-binding protein
MQPSVPAIRSKFFPYVWGAVRRAGVDPAAVVRHAHLPVALLSEAASLTVEQSSAFWRAVVELSGDPAIGLAIARNLDLASAPPIMLAPYHARDWRDAIERIARYKQMCAPERLRLREEGDTATVVLEWIRPRAERAAIADMMFGAIMALGRGGTGLALQARRVELDRPKADVSVHEAYFGGPVVFGATENRLVLARADLDRRFDTYNADLLEMLSPALERALADHQSRLTLSGQVKWLMKRRLATKRPDVPAIAQELAISERTLQRRLAEEGTRFQDVLAAARRELAHEYLADTQLEMGDVAYLLGFDDQNSFFRAFRQWEGETPARWRAARLGIAGAASAPRRLAAAAH